MMHLMITVVRHVFYELAPTPAVYMFVFLCNTAAQPFIRTCAARRHTEVVPTVGSRGGALLLMHARHP